MARLTTEEWELVRADYEARGMSLGELAEKYGVNKSSISRRAKSERWDQNATQAVITQTIENEKERVQLAEQMQHLNATTQRAANAVIIDRLAFENQNNQDMQTIRDLLMVLVSSTDKIGDLKQAMDILSKQREAMLGKAPDTAIQINNQNQTPPEIRRIIVDGNTNA